MDRTVTSAIATRLRALYDDTPKPLPNRLLELLRDLKNRRTIASPSEPELKSVEPWQDTAHRRKS